MRTIVIVRESCVESLEIELVRVWAAGFQVYTFSWNYGLYEVAIWLPSLAHWLAYAWKGL